MKAYEVTFRVDTGRGWDTRRCTTCAPSAAKAVSNARWRAVGRVASRFELVGCEAVS